MILQFVSRESASTDKKKLISAFFTVWLSVISFTIYAGYSNTYYPFLKNFERTDDQAGMQTWMITQADNGLLYFANNNGLLEFDGLNWELYGVFNYTIVRSVLATNEGRIYVGMSNDFGYFETDTRGRLEFTSMRYLLPENEQNIEEVWRIHKTPEEIIFQSFYKIIVIRDGKATIHSAPSKFHYSFKIYNKIYVVDKKEGILEFSNRKFSTLKGSENLANKDISAILPLGKDLMICTENEGVFLFKDKELIEWKTPSSEFLKRNQIYCATRIDEDRIAFGTIQKGIIVTDNNGVTQFAVDKSKGLQNNTVLSLKVDKSKNLWVGTDNGIDLLYINSPLSQLNIEKDIGSGYTAIIHNNYLYLGTNKGVFYRKWNYNTGFTDNSDEFRLIKETRGQVWQLKEIDGKLFCGHNKGSFIIDKEKATLLSDISGTWTFLPSPINPHKIIAGTYDGLILFEKLNGSWKFKKSIANFSESSRLMFFENNTTLWMSHGFKGVYKISLHSDLDSILKIDFYNSKRGFIHDFGINVTYLQDEIIFFSGQGAFQYNMAPDTIVPSDYYNSFFTQKQVNNAIEDSYGNIWYYQDFSMGLKQIRSDGTYLDITMPFKQLRGEFIEGFQFIFPIDISNYLISYNKGFVHFSPNISVPVNTPFNLYISKVELPERDTTIFSGHMFKDNRQIQVFPYNNNNLRFFYSAVNYESPDKVQFSTYLEGYDKNWSKWETRYNREFTNLREGSYTFQIKARNIYNIESDILSYTFIVEPPWKRTPMAYAVYSLITFVVIGIIALLIQKRIEFLKRKEEILQRKKYLDLEQQLQQEKVIAEKEIIRLRNEKLREQLKTKNKELANSTMQTIQRNEFLISLKTDMQKNNSEIINDIAKRHNKDLIRKIDNEINNEKNWKVFEKHFMNVHEDFLTRLKTRYPKISPAELRLCACLRMNISSKEIASLLNISLRGVEASRYRLRKALDLDRKVNLTDFILTV